MLTAQQQDRRAAIVTWSVGAKHFAATVHTVEQLDKQLQSLKNRRRAARARLDSDDEAIGGVQKLEGRWTYWYDADALKLTTKGGT